MRLIGRVLAVIDFGFVASHLFVVAAILLSAQASLGATTAEAFPARAAVLRVATFNIMWEGLGVRAGDLSLPVWERRTSAVIELIRRTSLDIVGIQEASSEQVDDLATRLPDYTLIHHSAINNSNPILLRSDRLRLLASGAFILNDVPETVGTNIGVRSATWSCLEDMMSGRTFTIYNFHLDHRSRGPSRQASAIRLAERIAHEEGAHLVTGDFNAISGSPTMRFLQGRIPLRNLDGILIWNSRPLINGYDVIHTAMNEGFVDHVLVSSDFAVLAAGRTPTGTASDHDIIWVDVLLE